MSALAIETIAGCGVSGNSDGDALKGGFGVLEAIAVGSDGSIYVADQTHHKIRKIENGIITTIAGCGQRGLQDGPALEAKFNFPTGLAVARDSTLYIIESNNRVRKLKDGVVSTFAGTDLLGWTGAIKNIDGPALEAQFSGLMGIALDPCDDSIMYLTEYSPHRIRMIQDGKVSTVVGTGVAQWRDGPVASALINGPHSIAVGLDGAVYFSDFGNHRIRMIKDGMVTTIAGSGVAGFLDGPALKAQFKFPRGVIVDADNNVIVADMMNHRIRVIKDGMVSTYAGGNAALFLDGPISKALLHSPGSIALDPDGTLLIPDFVNYRVRAIFNSGFVPIAAMGNPGPSLTKSLDVDTDAILSINGREIKIHQALFNARCPAILNSSARFLPIDDESLRQFTGFVYSDRLQNGLHAKTLFGLSYLFKAATMMEKSHVCLTQLHELKLGDPALPTVDDLVSLYCYCLELSPFEEGQKVVRKLLQRNRSALSPLMKQMPQLLGKFEDYLLDLMALVVMDDPPVSLVHQEASSNSFFSLETALQRLHETRNKDGDFDIVVSGHEPQRVHAFVLYSTWPYFAHMMDAGMRETSQRRLTLPPPDEDGGMHPDALSLILEIAYTKKFEVGKLSNELALSLLSVAGLYLQGHETNSADNIFRKLIHSAEKKVLLGIDQKTCIDIFKAATDLQIYNAAQKAKEVIVANFKSIIADPANEKKLKALPSELQCQILWKVVGK
eukprot:TRINITY_DN4039_c0_g1_i1.p1 TRINITY_DN4039_c0_g1~~TRINITY_DN4039_c0_g1_i1.p1  ORF type:complete len:727 (-),score=127.65 TRINITY_DN4039_c0_g1_i1:201-2381(-)